VCCFCLPCQCCCLIAAFSIFEYTGCSLIAIFSNLLEAALILAGCNICVDYCQKRKKKAKVKDPEPVIENNEEVFEKTDISKLQSMYSEPEMNEKKPEPPIEKKPSQKKKKVETSESEDSSYRKP